MRTFSYSGLNLYFDAKWGQAPTITSCLHLAALLKHQSKTALDVWRTISVLFNKTEKAPEELLQKLLLAFAEITELPGRG